MARVFDLKDIFKLGNDGFTNSSFTQHDGISNGREQVSIHVFTKLGHQMNALSEQSIEEVFRDISFIPVEFTKQFFDEPSYSEWLSVIGIARGEHKINDMPAVAGNQMKFKSIEPANRTLPASRQSVKHLVGVEGAIMAHQKRDGIDKADAGALPGSVDFQVDGQWHNHLATQLGKPVMGYQTKEQISELFKHVVIVEFLERADPLQMEQYLNGHHLLGG